MRRFFFAIVIVLLVFALVVSVTGEVLSRPARCTIGEAPKELKTKSVTLQTLSDESVAGWLIGGRPERGAVLLLHGVRTNRRQMLGRAKFLNREGYSVLLIDLPAHGESAGNRMTFGLREAEGVKAALRYMAQQLPDEKIAVIGVSLGAASFVLANVYPAPSAVVLESMYPTITEAIVNRIKLYIGQLGGYFAPLLLWQLPLRMGVSPEQLRPIAAIPSLHTPVLIASGSEDRHTTLSETLRIFQTANEPKELWIVEGAAHVDLYNFNPMAYESRISTFLAKYLRNAG
ncbi:MAG: alpha/beta hydrolase [Methylococcaceae bacterium]